MTRDQFENYSTHRGASPSDQSHDSNDETSTLLSKDSRHLLFTMAEASAALRISKWMLYRLVHRRQLDTVKIGRRRFVPATSLRVFVDQLRNSGAA